jgi:hypothetical protein
MTNETSDPIEFCPAAAIARDIARLEALVDVARHLIARAAPSPDCVPLMRGLEAILDDLILAADEARDRLAEAHPLSAAGAIAQLLAAIRDIRVGDDHECGRAKDLEAMAAGFLAAASFDLGGRATGISQTDNGLGG